jgi:hypothetical protein
LSVVSDSLLVPGRFNGPSQSGNGGYAAGALAASLEEPAEVNLRSSVPLDTRLDVVRGEDGSVRVLDGEVLVLEGRSVSGLDLEVPAAVSVDDAQLAAARYRGMSDGEFSHCFVCGRARDDGFDLFAGEVEGREVVASPWTPPLWTANPDGCVRPEFVWAVLDCPTYFATHMAGELSTALLARFTARVDAPVMAGAEHVVIAWPIEVDDRKHHAGSALLSTDG